MSRGRALGPGRLEKVGATWVLSYTDEARRRCRRVLGRDRRVAERVHLEVIRSRDMAMAGLGGEGGQEKTLGELLDLYLADLGARVTSAHIKNVRQRLAWLVAEIGADTRVRELRPAHLFAVRNRLKAGGRANRTANLAIDRLRAMFNWAVQSDLVGANPVVRLKRLPETRAHQAYRRRAMTESEIRAFLAAAEADDEENDLRAGLDGVVRVPQTGLWTAFLETGARWNELRLATWGDLDLKRGLLTLRAENTKSQKSRAIPLRAGLIERLRGLGALQETLLGRLPNVADRIFLSPEGQGWPKPTTNPMRIFDRLLLRAGIEKRDGNGEKLDLHALRHTLASRMARAGVPLTQAQRILGHSDPKLTAMVYVHVDAEDLRGAVEAMPELGEEPASAAARARKTR